MRPFNILRLFGLAGLFFSPTVVADQNMARDILPTWQIPIGDGRVLHLNGTVEHLRAFISENHPDLLTTIFPGLNDDDDSEEMQPHNSSLQQRDAPKQAPNRFKPKEFNPMRGSLTKEELTIMDHYGQFVEDFDHTNNSAFGFFQLDWANSVWNDTPIHCWPVFPDPNQKRIAHENFGTYNADRFKKDMRGHGPIYITYSYDRYPKGVLTDFQPNWYGMPYYQDGNQDHAPWIPTEGILPQIDYVMRLPIAYLYRPQLLPRRCTRVSCDHDRAIKACSIDMEEHHENFLDNYQLPRLLYIAEASMYIQAHCGFPQSALYAGQVKFPGEKWIVQNFREKCDSDDAAIKYEVDPSLPENMWYLNNGAGTNGAG